MPKTQTTHGLTRSHPFEYEQRAFHYILDTKIWANRQLPSYPGNISEIREHFRYVPQCTMNSYSLHPFYLTNSKIDRKSEQVCGYIVYLVVNNVHYFIPLYLLVPGVLLLLLFIPQLCH